LIFGGDEEIRIFHYSCHRYHLYDRFLRKMWNVTLGVGTFRMVSPIGYSMKIDNLMFGFFSFCSSAGDVSRYAFNGVDHVE